MRTLWRQPALPLFAASTLALGIGATSALFSMVDGVLLRSLDLPGADRLLMIQVRVRGELRGMSGPNVADLRDDTRSVFRAFAAISSSSAIIENPDGTREVQVGVGATWDVFEALGTPLQLGRPWGLEAQGTGEVSVVVLMDRLWRSRFGADSTLVGRTILLDGSHVRVAGVLSQGFEFPTMETAGFIHPLVTAPEDLPRNASVFGVIARLRKGASAEVYEQRLATAWEGIRARFPSEIGESRIAPMSLHAYMVRDLRPGLLALFGAAVLLLLLACANAANLLLARRIERRPELATRSMLGARPGRIVRLLSVEGAAVAAMAVVLGLSLAKALLWAASALAPPDLTAVADARLDYRALAFAMTVSACCSLMAVLLPALGTAANDLGRMMVRRQGRAANDGRPLRRLQSSLVVVQVASTLVLTVGAALLFQSFARLGAVEPGYRTDGVLTANVAVPGEIFYSGRARRTELFEGLEREVAALPGVVSVGTTLRAPFSTGRVEFPVRLASGPSNTEAEAPRAELGIVSAGYLDALQIPTVRGRGLTAEDGPGARRVALISRQASRTLFGGENPIGQRLEPVTGAWQDAPAWAEVVGVVGDIRLQGLDAEARGTIYLSMLQRPQPFVTMVVRVEGDVMGHAVSIRDALLSAEPSLPVPIVRSLASIRAESLAGPKFRSALVGLFAALATTLAAVGVYGLVSYSVATRTLEVGIRVAFGADKARVLRLVLGQALSLAGAGLAIGLIGSLLAGQAMRGLLYQTPATDPMTYASITLGVAGIAVIASVMPALRAAASDPAKALRGE